MTILLMLKKHFSQNCNNIQQSINFSVLCAYRRAVELKIVRSVDTTFTSFLELILTKMSGTVHEFCAHHVVERKV